MGNLSAGVVVLRWEGDKCRYLLLRAYRHWDFPKGIVEPGEDPLRAACREAEEETSLRELDFRWGPQYVETGPHGRGKVARYYVAETQEVSVRLPVSPMLGRPEHHEYRWVTFEEARGLLSPRMLPVLDWAAGLLG
jgi:8-oxo-dGTP pyrophosphatase MutT (NUDIX family)